MGPGAAKRLSSIKWIVVESMAWVWLLTLPTTDGIADLMVRLFQAHDWTH